MTDRALLVGINAYPGQPLNGCVNDVEDMSNFLVSHCGFATADVRLLVDARATTDGICERLKWLVADAEPDDRLFFHYSGHGTRFPIRNVNGNVESIHDSICPVNFDWTRGHALLDDDLRGIFDKVPAETEFVFVSDSCNSGDLTRAFKNYVPRFLVPPADIAWRLRTARDAGMKTRAIEHDRCALISGCRSDQESADAVFNNRPNGALTYYLLQALNPPGGMRNSLKSLIMDVNRRLEAANYDQRPQLRGPDALTGGGFLRQSKPAKIRRAGGAGKRKEQKRKKR